MDSVPYGLTITGEHLEIHSIDKLIVDYFLMFGSWRNFNDLLDYVETISDFRRQTDRSIEGYNCFLGKGPSSCYSWFQSSFWIVGLNVKFGLYNLEKDKDKPLKRWTMYSQFRVEFNPNKIFDNVLVGNILEWISSRSYGAILLECDYAVDVCCKPYDIQCTSLKDKVCYNDSRYYGKRHHNGRLKIYNKRREVLDKEKCDLGYDLTRCEVTCRCEEKLDFHPCVALNGIIADYETLSPNLQSICKLVNLLAQYGEDKLDIINSVIPDKRNRDKLIPCCCGQSSFTVFDVDKFYQLLEWYKQLYKFDYSFDVSEGKKKMLLKDRFFEKWEKDSTN